MGKPNPRQSQTLEAQIEAQMDALARREANLTAQIEGAVKMRASLAAERRRLIRVWLGIKKLENDEARL